MHYVAIRDEDGLSGKAMKLDIVTGDEEDPNYDRRMVWACTTQAGALYWALTRFRQARPLTSMHVYEAILDETTVEPDPNIAMPSSVMSASGTLGKLLGSYHSVDECLDAIALRQSEDPYVDRALASGRTP